MERTWSHFKRRALQIWPHVGAGWSTVRVSQDASGNPKVDEVTIDYSRKRWPILRI